MGALWPFKCNLNERPFLECVDRKRSDRMRPEAVATGAKLLAAVGVLFSKREPVTAIDQRIKLEHPCKRGALSSDYYFRQKIADRTFRAIVRDPSLTTRKVDENEDQMIGAVAGTECWTLPDAAGLDLYRATASSESVSASCPPITQPKPKCLCNGRFSDVADEPSVKGEAKLRLGKTGHEFGVRSHQFRDALRKLNDRQIVHARFLSRLSTVRQSI